MFNLAASQCSSFLSLLRAITYGTYLYCRAVRGSYLEHQQVGHTVVTSMLWQSELKGLWPTSIHKYLDCFSHP